jgi:5-methylthioadenosine/S-adenosylhomocysteine deaminase
MRNSADDMTLHDWLYEVVFPREKLLRPQDVRAGTQLALCEMIRSGTGAAADMYFFQETVLEAFVEAGARLNLSVDSKRRNASDVLVPATDDLERFLLMARQHGDDRVVVSVLMHSVYLYPDSLYKEMASMAADLGVGVQIHISETRREVKECHSRHGLTPPAYLEAAGFFKTPTLAAHCVHLNEDDRRILAGKNVTVVHNPSSNLKLASGIADLSAMGQAGIRIALGTDGAASNNNLDLFHEIRLAAFLAKGSTGEAATLDAASMLRMATLNGSMGMGFPHTGTIEVGNKADLLVLDAARSSMTPLGDPMSAFVYSADAACVESLMVDGRWLLRKRELTTLDEERIRAEAIAAARHIVPASS